MSQKLQNALRMPVVQQSSVPPDAIITVCRYVRPVVQFETGPGYSNLGGVTFVFTMDYGRRTVTVKFSICRANENFNKKDGQRHALSQLGETFNLDRFQDLADAVGGFTHAYLNMLNCKHVAGNLSTREQTLFNTMLAIQDEQIRQEEDSMLTFTVA